MRLVVIVALALTILGVAASGLILGQKASTPTATAASNDIAAVTQETSAVPGRGPVTQVTRATGSEASPLILEANADAQSRSPMLTVTPMSAAGAVPNVKDQGPSTISKTLVSETARLKDDTTGWSHKLQELELDLKLQLELKKEQDLEAAGNDIDGCLVVLRAAAGRLAPDDQTRVTFHRLELSVRELANRAEVHPNPEIRKTTDYFQQKTAELRALNRSVEETRTRLVTQIDQLEKLKIQLEFNRAAVQIGDVMKGGKFSLDNIQAIADDVQRLAADLDRHRRGEL